MSKILTQHVEVCHVTLLRLSWSRRKSHLKFFRTALRWKKICYENCDVLHMKNINIYLNRVYYNICRLFLFVSYYVPISFIIFNFNFYIFLHLHFLSDTYRKLSYTLQVYLYIF